MDQRTKKMKKIYFDTNVIALNCEFDHSNQHANENSDRNPYGNPLGSNSCDEKFKSNFIHLEKIMVISLMNFFEIQQVIHLETNMDIHLID